MAKIADNYGTGYTVYVVEHEDRNHSEPVAYTFSREEAAEIALDSFQRMSRRDQKETEVWVYGYECSEDETDLKNAKKTYETILDYDLEEHCCLRDCSYAGKLNKLEVKFFGCGSYQVTDDFGGVKGISVADYTQCYEDEYEAIDALYDDLRETLTFDVETVKDGMDVHSIEDYISCQFD